MRKMIIINADDFGFNENTNQAVIECFEKKFCSSATIMPNMPGFNGACQMAHQKNLIDCIGLHLVLKDGFPLTEDIKQFSRFCDKKGQLCFLRKKPVFFLTSQEKTALVKEIKAQIQKCQEAGISLTHIDSHYHIHNEWPILNILISVAKETKIPFIRLARNCGPDLSFKKKLYKYFFNQQLQKIGLAKTRYFGSVSDYIFLKKKLGSQKIESFEIMIHPRFDKNNVLVNRDDPNYLKDLMKEIPYQKAVSFRASN
jgi:predicted glycoside hydrolase/deacetylase ChbG (UPF0249 family)